VPQFLAAEATIRGTCPTAADVVSARVDLLLYDEQPAGLELIVVEGVSLTDSLATLYECPGDVTQAIVLQQTLCNTDSSARTPTIHVVPNGGAAAVSNQVFGDSLLTKETTWLEDAAILLPGDFIRVKASVTSVVSWRPTILEVL
jgi:hypothetical protein